MKTANEMLTIADKLVAGDRAEEYGDKKTMHNNIARLWSAYLNTNVTGHDVALMMTLLKMARTKAGKVTEDHDIIANFDDLETARRLVDIRSEADQLQGFSYKRYMVYSIQEEDGK
jgi:hypothetical protein